MRQDGVTNKQLPSKWERITFKCWLSKRCPSHGSPVSFRFSCPQVKLLWFHCCLFKPPSSADAQAQRHAGSQHCATPENSRNWFEEWAEHQARARHRGAATNKRRFCRQISSLYQTEAKMVWLYWHLCNLANVRNTIILFSLVFKHKLLSLIESIQVCFHATGVWLQSIFVVSS